MIGIKKSREPKELLTYRLQEFSSYDAMPHDIKTIVINSLMEEQGHLCAYCMRKIPVKKRYPTVTIEHLQPQNTISDSEKMNYQNMLAVCPGNRNSTDNNDKSCDAFRGSLTPREQNMTVNPLNPNTLSEIRYKDDGTIFSDNPVINDDLNNKLNLNCKTQMLPECRASALRELQKKVMKDNPDRTARKEYFEKLLDKYKEDKSNKPQYVGILINWLESKI